MNGPSKVLKVMDTVASLCWNCNANTRLQVTIVYILSSNVYMFLLEISFYRFWRGHYYSTFWKTQEESKEKEVCFFQDKNKYREGEKRRNGIGVAHCYCRGSSRSGKRRHPLKHYGACGVLLGHVFSLYLPPSDTKSRNNSKIDSASSKGFNETHPASRSLSLCNFAMLWATVNQMFSGY